jgi:cytochrome P450
MMEQAMRPEDIDLELLSQDPYPIYAVLREQAPAVWLPKLGMWMVTRYADVRAILMNSSDFAVGTEDSLLHDTFGEHMLSVDGALHRRYRDPQIQASLMPAAIRRSLETRIGTHVADLLETMMPAGRAEVRSALASRLPVLVMLDLFGLPRGDEPLFRSWYDSFESALSNHARDPAIRARAAANVAAFHRHFAERIAVARTADDGSLLHAMLNRTGDRRLTDEEVSRNALIIFFGGISTVEALILNCLFALLSHPEALARVISDRGQLGPALDETVRWLGPVQSATRHVLADQTIGDVAIPAGSIVNCMLGAANHDPEVFPRPERFEIDRPNLGQHLGFATGPHLCIGRHLALAEARAAISALLDRAPGLALAQAAAPVGHEFRQPRSLHLRWQET